MKLLSCICPHDGRQKAPGVFFWGFVVCGGGGVGFCLFFVVFGILIGKLYTASHCRPTTVASSAVLRTALTLVCMLH